MWAAPIWETFTVLFRLWAAWWAVCWLTGYLVCIVQLWILLEGLKALFDTELILVMLNFLLGTLEVVEAAVQKQKKEFNRWEPTLKRLLPLDIQKLEQRLETKTRELETKLVWEVKKMERIQCAVLFWRFQIPVVVGVETFGSIVATRYAVLQFKRHVYRKTHILFAQVKQAESAVAAAKELIKIRLPYALKRVRDGKAFNVVFDDLQIRVMDLFDSKMRGVTDSMVNKKYRHLVEKELRGARRGLRVQTFCWIFECVVEWAIWHFGLPFYISFFSLF